MWTGWFGQSVHKFESLPVQMTARYRQNRFSAFSEGNELAGALIAFPSKRPLVAFVGAWVALPLGSTFPGLLRLLFW